MVKMAYLHEVADVFNGKTPAKSDQRSQGFPVLKIRDVDQYGNFKGLHESFVEDSFAAKFRTKCVQPGDTLVLNAAHNADYVGSKVFFARESVANTLPTGEWLLVRAKETILHPGYINYWLRCDRTRKAIRFLVKGIHLYPKDVAMLQLPIPPFEEQERIVDLLSRAEGIVKLRREAQGKAAALIPAIFLEMFGDPRWNPKGWPTLPLNEVSEVISGVAKGRQLSGDDLIELPYMRVGNVKDGHLDLSEVKTMEIKRSEVEKLRIERGDLLMTEGGDPDKLGRAALWCGEIDLCVHQNHIFKVRSNSALLVPEYLRSLASSAYGKAYFLRVAKKTTGIASINKTQLSAFPVVLPPLGLQARFKQWVEAVESILAQQVSASATAQATFDSVLASHFRSNKDDK